MLSVYNVPWIESPLHDADINATGDEKKAHWHIYMEFSSVKAFSQVFDITKSLNTTIPQVCHSNIGLMRYMIHMDNPEKAQYKKSDIIAHCGAEIEKYFSISVTSRNCLIDEMMDYVDENRIMEISVLQRYARHERNDDWGKLLKEGGLYYIATYIKSIRHMFEAEEQRERNRRERELQEQQEEKKPR
jgi:hypothetical protein